MTSSKGQIRELEGRVAIVTGANAGLGFQTALLLAQRGAHVILACRSPERATAALVKLKSAVAEASLEIGIVNLGDLDSVRSFADVCKARLTRLDLLCNNAGVIAVPQSTSPQGVELHMATNYFGPFALTGQLLPLLAQTPNARIVNISSQIHRMAKLRLDDLNWNRRRYKPFGAYAQSKLAVTSFTLELDRRFRKFRSPITALLAHPGFAMTDVRPIGRFARFAAAALTPIIRHSRLVQTAAAGAQCSLYALTSPDIEGGDYIGPDNWLGSSGSPRRARPSPMASDPALASALWERSREVTGVSYLA